MTDATFHVLVVEDEVLAARQIARYLGDDSVRVTTVESGNAALRRMAYDPADVILTDLRMVDGDGIQLIRSVRRTDGALPIIVMTGQVLRDAETEALEAGASLVLRKPIDLGALGQAVEAYCAAR